MTDYAPWLSDFEERGAFSALPDCSADRQGRRFDILKGYILIQDIHPR